jgi:hypothetical protein
MLEGSLSDNHHDRFITQRPKEASVQQDQQRGDRGSTTSEDSIIAFLTRGGLALEKLFLYGEGEIDKLRICLWDSSNGLMSLIVENNRQYYAAKKYLHQIGAPHYRNRDELLQKGFQERWPQLIAGSAQGEWSGDSFVVRLYPQCSDDATLQYLVHDLRFAPKVKLDLSDGRISNEGLTLLEQLPQLEEVILSGNPATLSAIHKLQVALPNCKIVMS